MPPLWTSEKARAGVCGKLTLKVHELHDKFASAPKHMNVQYIPSNKSTN
jgi:hypothetical protein